ncbi:hypothetical protein DBA20_13470 [Pandoraea capi]|nr:hypothetical protein [Pandoraea sp. LA3]MDN4583994.1 hypothetical protein [Pandoraea capi]
MIDKEAAQEILIEHDKFAQSCELSKLRKSRVTHRRFKLSQSVSAARVKGQRDIRMMSFRQTKSPAR